MRVNYERISYRCAHLFTTSRTALQCVGVAVNVSAAFGALVLVLRGVAVCVQSRPITVITLGAFLVEGGLYVKRFSTKATSRCYFVCVFVVDMVCMSVRWCVGGGEVI